MSIKFLQKQVISTGQRVAFCIWALRFFKVFIITFKNCGDKWQPPELFFFLSVDLWGDICLKVIKVERSDPGRSM